MRILESIPLSASASLLKNVDIFLNADKFLKSLFETEGLPIELPLPFTMHYLPGECLKLQ